MIWKNLRSKLKRADINIGDMIGIFTIFNAIFLAFIGIVVVNYILPVYIYPTVDIKKTDIIYFHTNRQKFFESISKNWQRLLTGYKKNIREHCFSGRAYSPSELNQQYHNNTALIDKVTTENHETSHFLGNDIKNIVVYELEWYKKHAKKCPEGKSIDEIFKVRKYRQNMLEEVIRDKIFNPENIYPNHNNKYYDALP